MNEHIRTVFLLDEAVTLVVTKPLHASISHSDNLLSHKFSWFLPSGCHL
jgi:hypothetical protein